MVKTFHIYNCVNPFEGTIKYHKIGKIYKTAEESLYVKVNIRLLLIILGILLVGIIIIIFAGNSDEQMLTASEAEEYMVYSALIEEQFFEKVIVIRDHTLCELFPETNVDETLQALQEHMPAIQREVLEDFLTKNGQEHPLGRFFKTNSIIIFISDERIEEIFQGTFYWLEFYIRYPLSQGIMGLSRVGFNSEMDQALVYIKNVSGSLSGEGIYILLGKENGVWIIQDKRLVWIS